MPVDPRIRPATPEDAEAFLEILHEAVRWLEREGKPMCKVDELDPLRTAADVGAGLFLLAEQSGDPRAS